MASICKQRTMDSLMSMGTCLHSTPRAHPKISLALDFLYKIAITFASEEFAEF